MNKKYARGLIILLLIPILTGGYLFAADRLVVMDDNGNPKFIVTEEGKVAIGHGNPEKDLDIVAPTDGLFRLADNDSHNTAKVGRLVVRHYSNSEEPLYIFGAASMGNENYVAFGGGSNAANAATQVDFFTAPNTTTTFGVSRLTIQGNGDIGMGRQNPSYPLHMKSGARCTTGGSWQDASSREYKKDIKELTTDEAVEALGGLRPVRFHYKNDPEDENVGFIAEDVPGLVATKDRKGMSPMDVVAVLTKVVQEQQKTIDELTRKVSEIEKH